jgi:hypothetical protein
MSRSLNQASYWMRLISSKYTSFDANSNYLWWPVLCALSHSIFGSRTWLLPTFVFCALASGFILMDAMLVHRTEVPGGTAI